MTNAILMIVTPMGRDIGLPFVIVETGKPMRDRMDHARVDEGESRLACELQGRGRMDQIT